jgi:hypothetical protein
LVPSEVQNGPKIVASSTQVATHDGSKIQDVQRRTKPLREPSCSEGFSNTWGPNEEHGARREKACLQKCGLLLSLPHDLEEAVRNRRRPHRFMVKRDRIGIGIGAMFFRTTVPPPWPASRSRSMPANSGSVLDARLAVRRSRATTSECLPLSASRARWTRFSRSDAICAGFPSAGHQRYPTAD